MLPICETCGTQYAETPAPPAQCPVCEDERQYVGWKGQAWTTHDGLRANYKLRLADEAGVLAIGLAPDFAINQRALFLPPRPHRSRGSGIPKECCRHRSLKAKGGVDKIVISHPHFYAAMLEWSDAFGGIPILLHEADKAWVQRPSPAVQFWSGDVLELSRDVTLLRCGGHFAGSAAIHWTGGPRAGGALFPGDALQVVMDRRHVTFMYSYPNYVPMKPSDVRHIRALLAGRDFDDVFGFTWGRNIIGGGRRAVDASFDRYLAAVAG